MAGCCDPEPEPQEETETQETGTEQNLTELTIEQLREPRKTDRPTPGKSWTAYPLRWDRVR